MARTKKSVKSLPETLFNMSTRSLYEFQKTAGIDAFKVVHHVPGKWRRGGFTDNVDTPLFFTVLPTGVIDLLQEEPTGNIFRLSTITDFWGKETDKTLLYVTENGDCWTAIFNMEWDKSLYGLDNVGALKMRLRNESLAAIQLSSWSYTGKYTYYDTLLQGKEGVLDIMQKLYPYMHQWLSTKDLDYGAFMMCPFLETLVKAGYKFADNFTQRPGKRYPRNSYVTDAEIAKFNMLCKPGKNPKEIFTIPPAVFTALKDVTDISIWDELRKLGKKIDANAVRRLAEMDLKKDDMKLFCGILKRQYEGRPVFTLDSLLKYIDRVDVYEAIRRNEALTLINDYLLMCQNIGKKPVITGDSLKREHDVTARMGRELRTGSEYDEKIKEAGKKLLPFTYKEDTFIIRPIANYDELIDESSQQGNCLAAAYPGLIAKGKRHVFTMRNTSAPETSLATVELYSDFTLGQHLLSHNREMTNQSQLKFIKRWMKHVAEVRDYLKEREAKAC